MKQWMKIPLLSAVLLLLSFTVPQRSLAAGTLELSKVSGAQGDTVVMDVRLTSDDVYSGNFNIRFDSTALRLTAVEKNSALMGAVNQTEDGTVRVSFAQTSLLTDTTLCTLTFQVTADTAVSGSSVYCEQVRLYDLDGIPVSASVIHGTVSRDCAWLRLDSGETAEHQAVRAEVSLAGALAPFGGNFSISYDPALLKPTSVLPLEGAAKAAFTYNLETPGIVRISFAAASAAKAGPLCAVVFHTIGSAGKTCGLTMSDAQLYDEESRPLDTEISNGSISIVLPSDRDPKLWVVGGALQSDGTAVASLLLQGRGLVHGGQFTLRYMESMELEILENAGCTVSQEEGALHIALASDTPFGDDVSVLTVKFSGAQESTLSLTDVCLYDGDSKQISVVDIRPGKITALAQLTAVADDVTVISAGGHQTVTIAVDVADICYGAEEPTLSVIPILALYENGKLKGLDMQSAVALTGGVSEFSLSASSTGTITEYRVLLLDCVQAMKPLCEALSSDLLGS